MIDRPTVQYAAESGHKKYKLLKEDLPRYFTRSIFAGMYLSLVVIVYWSLLHNLHDVSIGKVIASAFFGVGLTIIVFSNTELFTSNNMYLAISSFEGKTTWAQTFKLWSLCYLGNLVGALIVAGLLYGAGTLQALPPDHALFDGAAHKVHQSPSVIFFKGILANWAVCLAVRLAIRMKEEVAKILILIFVVFIFLYLGFEHSIANMGAFAMSLAGQGSITLGDAGYNLLFSTLGNIIGGAALVGIPFAYLNPQEKD